MSHAGSGAGACTPASGSTAPWRSNSSHTTADVEFLRTQAACGYWVLGSAQDIAVTRTGYRQGLAALRAAD